MPLNHMLHINTFTRLSQKVKELFKKKKHIYFKYTELKVIYFSTLFPEIQCTSSSILSHFSWNT